MEEREEERTLDCSVDGTAGAGLNESAERGEGAVDELTGAGGGDVSDPRE